VSSNITKTFHGVIFDLDGTLIDTAGEIEVALRRTFEELALPALSRKAVEALIGRGVPSMVERALAQAGGEPRERDRAIERFEGHYARLVGSEAALFPGVREGLDLLRKAGTPMSVVTNKPRYFTERLLERAGVLAFFAGVVAGDDGVKKKPAPDMLLEASRRMGVAVERALMVGDSVNDVAAARAAGCAIWCVPYGYNEGRGPETLACDRLVGDVHEAAREVLRA
jgi:phosphoglycolate phosphatase